MLAIILIPVAGLVAGWLVGHMFPKAQFSGWDVLPFFFVPACGLITIYNKKPSFLPYGFLTFFILVLLVVIRIAIREKNMAVGKTFHLLWQYLTMCSCLWYVCLLVTLV
ncbi:DUF3397 family protein [Lactobacillus corticis]|uniref:DUF3397 domain-containing protein n=1 Tax=Lactobacillus corticis TaxID=2201249 RepID=A0A916QHY5_9LACO|nr:DUF3397 family protein [Lactobacillus corticis]GFZ27725.1 hypothetical protein LCB40_16050 [Lactobacillus corticis]